MPWEIRVWENAAWVVTAHAMDAFHAVRAAEAFLRESGAQFAEVWGPGRGVAFGEWVVTDRLTA